MDCQICGRTSMAMDHNPQYRLAMESARVSYLEHDWLLRRIESSQHGEHMVMLICAGMFWSHCGRPWDLHSAPPRLKMQVIPFENEG